MGEFKVKSLYKFFYKEMEAQNIGFSELNVFPNPTQSLLNIKSNKDIHSIRLYSLEGKEILLGNSKACNQFLLGNLSANVYVLKVTFMDGSIQFRQVVKF